MSSSETTKLIAVSAISAAIGAGALYLYLRPPSSSSPPSSSAPSSARHETAPSTSSAPSTFAPGAPGSAQVRVATHTMEDDILREHFTRNMQFFGEDKQLKIAKSFVVVVGLGGVGSHAAHFLLRSGVGRLRLVDFDQVTLSSLNRHAVATREDVGLPKATCLARHFQRIVPECEVDSMVSMYTREAEEEVLGGKWGKPDYVIDAIDNIDTKIDLLAACHRRGIPVLCSGGAGARADPTRLRICDVSESSTDQLGRKVRTRLRLDHGIETGIPVLFSLERPRVGLVSHVEEGADQLEYQVIPGFRVRTIPVLGTMPAIFGMAAATHVLCALADWGLVTEPVESLKSLQYDTLLHRLIEAEESAGRLDECSVDIDDVIYVVRELWRGRSAFYQFTGTKKGPWKSISTTDMTLTRWNPALPARVDNLILATFAEAERHAAEGPQGVRARDPGLWERIEAMVRHARQDHGIPENPS